MPVNRCRKNNKPGYRWGSTGCKSCECYTYDPNNKGSETKAKNKAMDQGIAIGEFYGDLIDRLQKIRKKLSGD